MADALLRILKVSDSCYVYRIDSYVTMYLKEKREVQSVKYVQYDTTTQVLIGAGSTGIYAKPGQASRSAGTWKLYHCQIINQPRGSGFISLHGLFHSRRHGKRARLMLCEHADKTEI
jgi:hypothetical protein